MAESRPTDALTLTWAIGPRGGRDRRTVFRKADTSAEVALPANGTDILDGCQAVDAATAELRRRVAGAHQQPGRPVLSIAPVLRGANSLRSLLTQA